MSVLTLSSSSAASLPADAVVIGIGTAGDGAEGAAGAGRSAKRGRKAKRGGSTAGPVLAPGGGSVDQAFGGKLAETLRTLGAKGGEGEVTKVPAPNGVKADLVLAVGLGSAPEDGGDYAPETLRRAAGAAARALAGSQKAVFALPTGTTEAVAAVAEGALLGAYAFTAYRGKQGDDTAADGEDGERDPNAPLAEVVVAGAKPRDRRQQAAVERAGVLAAAVHRARDLVNTPSNDLTPERFARIARTAAREYDLTFDEWDEKALADEGYGGILGVGQGSANPPRLVRVSYRHPAAKRTLALVGKGITYDSGGISLKPATSNVTMKCDMSGAAAVLATVVAVARLELPVTVTGWLALAENMPSGSATRPGDVLRMYGGTTVEVLNTDAEGRLVMADALVRACEEEPDAVVDVATLTGAMMVALGSQTFGIMANDDAFRTLVHETAEQAGEQSWPMPLPRELRKSLDSSVADLQNVGDRLGGGLLAGLFLKEFVSEGTRWAHLDIAGPAFHEGAPFGYTPKGGTGSAVRTLVRLAERTAEGDLG